MRKISAKILSLVLVIAAAIFMTEPVSADSAPKRKIIYTALGDSISTGYKLKNTANSYVSLFGRYLSAETSDLGQNGLDSSGLLKKLNTDQNVIAHIRKSDVVTVSMGGNDMLRIFAALKPTDVGTLISAVREIQGTAMQKKLEAGIATFRTNWPKVIKRLKELNPKAKIIVTTLINPYQGIAVSIPVVLKFDLGAYSDGFVRQINAIIKKDAVDYQVADSYAIFKSHSGEKLTNADLSSFEFDPHPNISGHALIFRAHELVKINFTDRAIRISGPGTITISPYAYAADAKYEAAPLLSCLSGAAVTDYSVESAGTTGAKIDSKTGVLTVKKPGTLKLKAVVTMQNSNLSAQGTLSVRVAKEKPAPEKPAGHLPLIAGFSALAAAILLLVLFRWFSSRSERKRRRKRL